MIKGPKPPEGAAELLAAIENNRSLSPALIARKPQQLLSAGRETALSEERALSAERALAAERDVHQVLSLCPEISETEQVLCAGLAEKTQ